MANINRLVISALALLLGASCVAQSKYQEAVDTTKLYQRMVHDLEQYVAEVESELDRRRAHDGLAEGGAPVESSFTGPIDERIAELREIENRIAGLGAEGDVTFVQFDGGYGFSLRDSVLFDSGSAELRASGRQVVEALGRELAGESFDRLWVRGHTDSDRIVRKETKARFPHGNLQLSAARAVSVASALTSSTQLDTSRVVVAGYGPNEPVAANDSAENKQRNRRVEIFVETGASGD